MPLTYVTGDPRLTQCQALAFGHNARGRTELGALETLLLDQSPAAFATYSKLCRSQRIKPGTFWVWREALPFLTFMVIRESSVGATRLRFVESVVMTLARDYRLHGLQSVAFAPIGDSQEWPLLRPVLDYWLRGCPLHTVIYEEYAPGVQADETPASA